MSRTINFRIKIKISIFLNFFIVPPPPVMEEMSLTTRWWLLHFYYSTTYSYCLYKLTTMPNSKLSKTQACKWHHHKRLPWGTPLGVVVLWRFLLTKSHRPKKPMACSWTNIMKYRLRRSMPWASLYPIQLKRHRLHNVTRDVAIL